MGDDVIDIEGAFTQKQNDSTPVEQAGEKDVNVTSITGADNYIITAYAGEITAISSALFIEVKNALTFDFANKTVDSVIPVYNEGESAWSIQVKSGTTILAQSDISLYYNNNGITSLTSGIENALTGIEFTFPANTKNASTYEITVVGQGSFSNEARFIVIGESNAEKATTSLVINKKSVDVVWTNVDYTYNGGIIHPTAKIVDVDSNDVNCDIATTMTTKNIGSYTATASINDTINYELTESTKNYTITPKQITLSGMTKEFNGTRDFSQTFDHDNFVEIVDGDTVVVTGEFAKDATAEEITNGTSINLIGLSSTNKNYSFAATGTGVITKNTTWIIAVQGEFEFTYGDVIDFSELTIKNQSNKDLASYVDKTIVLPDQKSNSGNLKASDEKYDIQINLTSSFIEINETTYPTANKNLADALKINKKEVVITISSPNKLYDGMSAVAGYSVGDRVSGDLVSVDGVNYASSSTGTHAFNPVISGVDKDNYSFVCDPIEGTISSKIIEIKVVGKTNGVFVSDGNTNDFEQTINNYNEEIELSALNNPARTGYEFKGWFEDESLQTALTKEKLNELLENSIDTDGNVLADITLYAKFDIKTYNVTVQMFDINDNVVNWGSFITNPTSNSQTGNDYNFNYYTNVVITPTANDNYVLVSSENLNIANISQTETAKIIFRPVNLVVAFDIPNPVHSNVEGDISSINLNYETLETISLPTLTAQGYEFKNWSYNDGITDINFPSARTLKQIFEEINGSAIYADGYEITLKALWSAKAFDITYQANGGEFGDEEPSKTENIVSTTFATELNTATNYLTPSREGYTFKGWKHIEQGQENDFAEDAVFKTAAQMTLVAKWDQDIYEISVTTTDNSKVDNISMVQGDQITNGTIDGGIYKFNVYSLTNYKIKITMQNGFGIEGLTANGNDYISEEKQFTVSETFNYIVEALTRDMTFTTQFVDSLKITISDDNIFTDTDTVIDISKTDNTTAGRAENEFAFTVNVGKFIKVVATAQKGYSADHRNTSLVQGSNTGFDKENKDYVILSGFVDNCKFKLNATPESYIVTITKGAGVESFEIISGAINDNGDLKVTTGIPFKFKAIYSHGYEKAEVSSLTSGTAGTVENTDFAEITVSGFNEAFSLSVSAEKKDFNVQYGAYFIDNNRLVVSEETDNVSVEQNGQPVTTAEFESHVSFKANGVEGYNIVGWFLAEDLEVDSNILYYNVGEVKNVDNVQVLDNIKYIAVFKQQVWSLKASAKDREGTFKVSISSSEEEAFNEYNETLGSGVAYSIEAVANSGYEFLEWQNENGDFVSANPIYAGTLTDNTERIAVFNPKQGKINISVNMYLNGIPQPERKTIYGEIIAGTWNGTIFTAGDTGLNGAELNPVTGYAENDFKFLTDQDLFIKIVVKNGYEFINILSVEGEKDIANIQSVENGIEGDNTYHIYRISNLNADNNYSDAEVRVDGEENELNIIFVDNEGTRVNAGGIYVDVLEEPGVTSIIRTGGKGSSNVSVWAYTGSYIEIKAYTKFDFDISNDQTIVGDGISYTFTKPLDEEVSQENGFTSLITIKIENINSDFINENAIKIKTVTTEYEIYLMDNKRKIAEISGVRNGHCFNIPEEINQAIINLIADKSAIGLSLKGFNTAINGGGTQYVFFNSSSSKWDCFKEWDSHPYQFNGNEYEFAPNFEIVEENGQKKGVFKIYASWIQLKSNIEIFTSPETLRAEPPTVKAGEVIQTLNSVNSWVNSNDPFVADMLYGADIKIKAPTYKGYKFKNWIITYGSKEEIIETQVYEKKGGFGVESVTMTAIYSPRFEISSTNGGSAKLVQGGLEIINGTADYIENHRDITLVVEPLSGFKFDGWYIKGTNDLFVNLLDHSITIDGKDFTETSLEARFSGKDIQIFVADYDDSQGKIFSVYRGEELLFGEDESGTLITHSPFEATVGEILEITIQVNQGFDGKSGVFWNDLTGINFKTRYDKGVYEYLVYNYVIKGEDLKEGLGESDLDYITLYPEIVEQKIKIVFDITFEGSDEFAVAGSVNLDELENGIALVSYGKEVLINISVNKNYKIESIVFNGLSYLMKLEDGVLPLPSSAFSETLGDNISYTLRIKFAKAMWINETMSESLKGNGTKENPYIIGSTNDLILILNKVNVEKDEQYQNAHYRLEKDINLNGKFWTPIGTELFPFNGFVVLSGFRFTNLTLDPDHVGVTTFGNVFGATGEDFKIVETDNALIIIIATISSAVLIVIIVLSAVFISKRVKKNKLDDLATGQYKDN